MSSSADSAAGPGRAPLAASSAYNDEPPTDTAPLVAAVAQEATPDEAAAAATKPHAKPAAKLAHSAAAGDAAAVRTKPADTSDSAATSAEGEQTVVVERREGGIALVKLNRPSSLNAMTVRMGEQFLSAMQSLSADPSLRVVVLTGEGTAFSAGGDLDFLLARCDSAAYDNSREMRGFYARFLSLLQLPVPIIAAIHGPAIGAGACVAAACDLRVAAKTTDIGFTFSKLGLHPGMGATHTLPRLVGMQHAARLLLTGDIIKGEKAAQMGLVASWWSPRPTCCPRR